MTAAIRKYYLLTKPGIIYSNSITNAAGFFLAAQGNINFLLLLAAIAGLAFIMAGACVFNNYIDRGIDSKMERTKKRALAVGKISEKNALIYATVLTIFGTAALSFTNLLAVTIALLGVFFYVVVYGIAKRRSVHGTIVGSISGAVPPVVGYVAAGNSLDLGALILFLILVVWQMPHFYAIAIFRKNDYAAAKLPVLSVVKGIKETKIQILIYIIIFAGATSLLTIFKFTGFTYLVIMLTFCLIWFGIGVKGFKTKDENRWAKKMFGFSLLTLVIFSIMISLSIVLP